MAAASPRWELDTEYIQACNCDYGCPCNFNALPTYGNCEALAGWRVKSGHFGPTKLDGVKFAWACWWPKAIHEGHGIMQLYIDTAATPEQAKAIEEIANGRHGGGIYEVFARTWETVHPTKRARIDWHFAGYDSWFTVEGHGEARMEHIKNPVTGAKFEGEVVLPGGINFKRALVTNIKHWWMRDEGLLARHVNKGGFVTTSRKTNEGAHP